MSSEVKEKAKHYLDRWQSCAPTAGLTWGKILTGDNFIALANKRRIFAPQRSILELGPGYGRILKSLLDSNTPFSYYTGLDISHQNISYLQTTFKNERVDFAEGSFETVKLEKKYDILVSSLVLKHQYPNFEKSLANILKYMNKGGILFFDLLENRNIYEAEGDLSSGPIVKAWEHDNTYVTWYTQKEVMKMLHKLKLEFMAFDHVVHLEQIGDRLVVIARVV